MDNLMLSFGYSLLKVLIYGSILTVLIVQFKRGASWRKKFSVLVASGFCVVKFLAELLFTVLYLLLHLQGGEQLQTLISIVKEVVNALSGLFLSANTLLCLVYLGKVKRSKK